MAANCLVLGQECLLAGMPIGKHLEPKQIRIKYMGMKITTNLAILTLPSARRLAYDDVLPIKADTNIACVYIETS